MLMATVQVFSVHSYVSVSVHIDGTNHMIGLYNTLTEEFKRAWAESLLYNDDIMEIIKVGNNQLYCGDYHQIFLYYSLLMAPVLLRRLSI